MSLIIFIIYLIVYRMIAALAGVENPIDSTALIVLAILAAAETIRMTLR